MPENNNEKREKWFSVVLTIYIFSSLLLSGVIMTEIIIEDFENPPPYFSEKRYNISWDEFVFEVLILLGKAAIFAGAIFLGLCLILYLYEKIVEKRHRKRGESG